MKLDPSIIGVWLPIFIVIIVIIPQQQAIKNAAVVVLKRKKRGDFMTNELIQEFKGYNCYISTGAFGASVTGRITDIKENWIEVQTKKGRQVLNLDFIQIIRIKE